MFYFEGRAGPTHRPSTSRSSRNYSRKPAGTWYSSILGAALQARTWMEQAMTHAQGLPPIAVQRKANGRLVPSINGRRWNKLEAVAECLFDNLGRGIPYLRPLGVIGRNSANPTSRHLLRQYIST